MSWKPGQLISGYRRSIIGYDLRHKIYDFDCFPNSRYFSHNDKKKFPATIDNQIWPEVDDKYEIESQCNGFNLFDRVDVEIQKKAQESNTALVAFDIPAELANNLTPTFGLLPQSLDMVEHLWKFLGYDIVDIRTQMSAMFSFNWTKHEINTIFIELSIELNCYGLIQSEIDALRISSIFDKIIPEHSPFAPCGIWINIETSSK